MQNKWNQSKQKATGLILFITHPRVSDASPDIPSHMERGNPAGPPRWAGTGRDSTLTGHSPCSALWLVLGHLAVPPSLSSHCLAPSDCSLGLHQSPATHCLGMMPQSSQGMWSGGGMRSRALTPAQNSWHWMQHHLHGHFRHLESMVEDPAAGSSPRCRVN